MDNTLSTIIKSLKSDFIRVSFQDIDGKLLYVSNKLANELGMSYVETSINMHFSALHSLSNQNDIDIIAASHENVMRGETSMLTIYNSHINMFYSVISISIYDINYNVIAAQSIYAPILAQVARQIYCTNYLSNVITYNSGKFTFNSSNLSALQESIIFLLISGKNQKEIAKILGCSRSNVAKHIVILCRIFSIESREKCLIDECLKNGYDKFIPKQILQHKVVRMQDFSPEVIRAY